MNIALFSPALTLLYVFTLLSILMGVDAKALNRTQRWTVAASMFVMCAGNHLLYTLVGAPWYGKLLFLTMHLPMFLLFLYITKRGIIKTSFMILTALVFSSPATIVTNILHNILAANAWVLLSSYTLSYGLMLLIAHFLFRSSFIYLLQHCDNKFFLLFSLIPLVYYVYIFAYINVDISSLKAYGGFLVRLLPNLEVFGFYFLLPYIYKTINDKMLLKSSQEALQQELSAAANQISLMNEADMQMAVYRHDMRHQLLILNGFLSAGKTEQAQNYIEEVVANLDAIPLKRYCENEIVNLLCSSYDSKAKHLGVQLKIDALLPPQLPLSDTELCSVISNGLENALVAASHPEVSQKWVAFSCHIKQNTLFIMIRNSYAGQIAIRNGLPVSAQDGHGYGCYSIQAIVQRNGGLSSFEAQDGQFTLRLSVPLPGAPFSR